MRTIGARSKAGDEEDDVDDEFQKNVDRKVVSFDLPDDMIPENVREERKVREKEIEKVMKELKLSGKAAKEIANFSQPCLLHI